MVCKVLMYGADGFIGTLLQSALQDMSERKIHILKSTLRLDDTLKVKEEIKSIKPHRIICCVGRTSGKQVTNVDYLENHLDENVRDNLFAPIALSALCTELGIHCTVINSGCIFEYDGNGTKFHEDDIPNFKGSAYSIMKGYCDRLLHQNAIGEFCLNVRIRMPITNDPHPKDFVTKIVSYPKIHSVPNSMTHLPSLLPLLADMIIIQRTTGTINLTNPGVITHKEILDLKPNHECQYINEGELNQLIVARRSNNHLHTGRLETLYPNVLTIQDAIHEVAFHRGWIETA